jgi:hypothetical protein
MDHMWRCLGFRHHNFAEYPLRYSMDLVELGARSMFLVDLEFLELRCLAGKTWSGVIFSNLELLGALPNTPLVRT